MININILNLHKNAKSTIAVAANSRKGFFPAWGHPCPKFEPEKKTSQASHKTRTNTIRRPESPGPSRTKKTSSPKRHVTLLENEKKTYIPSNKKAIFQYPPRCDVWSGAQLPIPRDLVIRFFLFFSNPRPVLLEESSAQWEYVYAHDVAHSKQIPTTDKRVTNRLKKFEQVQRGVLFFVWDCCSCYWYGCCCQDLWSAVGLTW